MPRLGQGWELGVPVDRQEALGVPPPPKLRSPSNLSQLHYSWPVEWPETQPCSSGSLCRTQQEHLPKERAALGWRERGAPSRARAGEAGKVRSGSLGLAIAIPGPASSFSNPAVGHQRGNSRSPGSPPG